MSRAKDGWCKGADPEMIYFPRPVGGAHAVESDRAHTACLRPFLSFFFRPKMPVLVRSPSFSDSILRPAWPSPRGFAYLGQRDQRVGDDSIITVNLVKQDASRSCTIYLSIPPEAHQAAPKIPHPLGSLGPIPSPLSHSWSRAVLCESGGTGLEKKEGLAQVPVMPVGPLPSQPTETEMASPSCSHPWRVEFSPSPSS